MFSAHLSCKSYACNLQYVVGPKSDYTICFLKDSEKHCKESVSESESQVLTTKIGKMHKIM